MSSIVNMYVNLIVAGRKTLEQVPEGLREEVSQILEEMKTKE